MARTPIAAPSYTPGSQVPTVPSLYADGLGNTVMACMWDGTQATEDNITNWLGNQATCDRRETMGINVAGTGTMLRLHVGVNEWIVQGHGFLKPMTDDEFRAVYK